MADSKSLTNAMNDRNPSTQRRGVVPIDPLNPHTPIPSSSSPIGQEQEREVATVQKLPYKQISFDARADYVKAIKQIALDTDRNEKDVYNEALGQYIDNHPRSM